MANSIRRKDIYDAAQRLLHWWIALSTLLLMISGLIASYMEPGNERAFIWGLHMSFGKILIVGFVGRLFWGAVGPEHAHWRSFFHPKEWLQTLKNRRMLSADGKFGHHPQASISYLALYGLIAAMSVSGLLLSGILHGVGPLGTTYLDQVDQVEVFRLVHDIGFWLIAVFILSHVAALIFHESKDHIPVSQSMISGFQYRTRKDTTIEKEKTHEKVA